MEKCSEDWKTCGHYKAAFGESEIYPSCDKVGFLEAVFGSDVCPNALAIDDSENENSGKPECKRRKMRQVMAKRKEDCLDKLIKDTNAKRDAEYDVLVKMLSEIVKTMEKYDKLAGLLKKHGRVPADLRDIEALCVEAGSDETLDKLMDVAGVDTLDEFEAFVKRWAKYGKAHENQMPVAWMDIDDGGGISDITTTPDFWDCNCSHDYIHPKKESKCPKCGARKGYQPDSRANEVIAYFEDEFGIKYPAGERKRVEK